MNDSRITSITQLHSFLKSTEGVTFHAASREEMYAWITDILCRFKYFKLRKKDKGVVRDYIQKMTGLSTSQITRLIHTQRTKGEIKISCGKRYRFPKKYTPEDIALLATTDVVHQCLSGPATKAILRREYHLFNNAAYERLKDISNGQIYNLRKTLQYLSKTKHFTKTKQTRTSIGERRKPYPEGKSGYLRVDTVHQGDLDGEKGVYHINTVDEVTQWEVVGAVEKISEIYMKPLLVALIDQYPFKIIGFHSDNGSEYINRVVAKLLNKLLIEQTKSRARQTNDNALVEGKNGSIIRKHMGYVHIPQKYAKPINRFYLEHLNIYVNYHRPSGFATIIMDKKGKQKKVYKRYLTPYEMLRGLPGASKYLKDGITFDCLDKIAYQMSDNECAAAMQEAKRNLFKSFRS